MRVQLVYEATDDDAMGLLWRAGTLTLGRVDLLACSPFVLHCALKGLDPLFHPCGAAGARSGEVAGMSDEGHFTQETAAELEVAARPCESCKADRSLACAFVAFLLPRLFAGLGELVPRQQPF